MRPVARLCSLLTLILFLSPVLLAGDPPATNSKSGKSEPAKVEPAAAKVTEKEAAKETKATESASPAPAAVALPAPQADNDKPLLRPIPATTGGLGLFTLETGETLPRRGVGYAFYTNKFAREPGSVSVLQLGMNVSYGIVDWVTAYLHFLPYQHFHVSRPGRLSFNSLVSNPQFGNTIYRSLLPIAGNPPGYVEDYPFVSNNDGGIGEFTLGLKWGLWSERRGAPVSLAVMTDFHIPSRTSLSDLLDEQGQSGQFNFGVRGALSKNFGDLVVGTFNLGYRFTRDPRFGGVRALRMADQVRAGTGLLFFPERRIQLMSEYNVLVFTGESTQNTSFGARDPFEIIAGVRLYPFRNVALDVGYRNTANLQAHGDRNGFIVKLGAVHWPGAPPKPANRPPMAACTADKSSVYAGSDEVVGVSARASDPDGDTLSYAWNATGGRVDGSGSSVRWNSANAAPGVYTVTSTVTDGMGGSASCSVDIRVEPRPNRAPSLTCSAERSSVLAGERVRIRGEASDPDGDQLTYSWRTNGGTIVGSGSSVQLDTSGLAPGRYSVTGRVEDGRGGAADCSTAVAVEAPPAPPQASKLNECFFRASSARVDNVCKRVLDDVALRLQNSPRAKVVIVGYADPKEPRPDRLAGQRATAAQKYLGEKGIPAARVEVRNASGQTGAGRQNQRIFRCALATWAPCFFRHGALFLTSLCVARLATRL